MWNLSMRAILKGVRQNVSKHTYFVYLQIILVIKHIQLLSKKTLKRNLFFIFILHCSNRAVFQHSHLKKQPLIYF